MTRPATHLLRLLRWGRILARHGALRGIEQDRNTPLPVKRLFRLARLGTFQPRVPDYAGAFRAIGPAAIKLGQTLATRPDIVGEEAAQKANIYPMVKTQDVSGQYTMNAKFRVKPSFAVATAQTEAAALTQSKPALKESTLKLDKLTALIPVTDELLEDSAAMGSYVAAKAGVTTGEWGAVMRAAFGEYRAPTGVSRNPSNRTEGLEPIREAVDAVSSRLGRRLKFVIGKPGLDGHSNGAEQIAARARDCGMDIHYQGIRLTPAEIVAAAAEEEAHVVGLSILSGSHVPLITETMERMRAAGLGDVPVVVGGIIPEDDARRLRALGVAAVYTPKDFELNRIMSDIVTLVDGAVAAAE